MRNEENLLGPVFIVKDTGGGTPPFQEQSDIDGTWGDYTHGRTPDNIDDVPAGCFAVVAVHHGEKMRYVRIGGGGTFPVLVKYVAGSDGTSSTSAAYTYDLYALADTGYATSLNLSGAIQPKCSPARIIVGTVTKAPDGSVGMAYRDSDGIIQLWSCQELRPPATCTDGTSGISGGTL